MAVEPKAGAQGCLFNGRDLQRSAAQRSARRSFRREPFRRRRRFGNARHRQGEEVGCKRLGSADQRKASANALDARVARTAMRARLRASSLTNSAATRARPLRRRAVPAPHSRPLTGSRKLEQGGRVDTHRSRSQSAQVRNIGPSLPLPDSAGIKPGRKDVLNRQSSQQ